MTAMSLRTGMGVLLCCLIASVAAAAPPMPLTAAQKWHGLHDPNPQVRAEAAARLGGEGTVAAHVGLMDLLLTDPHPVVRAAAARAIARTRNADLREPLQWAAQRDSDAVVRQAANEADLALRPFAKIPRVAGGLALLPGVGHYYLGQYGKGAAYTGSIVGLALGGLALLADDPSGGSIGDASDPNLDANDPIGLLMVMAAQNTLMYSVFDAYRTARVMRHNDGYRYPVSEEGLPELLMAPFAPSIMKSPWVWAGVPLMVASAVGLSLVVSDGGLPDRSLFDDGGVNFLGRRYGRAAGFGLGSAYFAGIFAPVGVGEEALFRGVLLPAFSESFGVGWGLTLSSLAFGAAHLGNFGGGTGYQYDTAALAVPFITLGGAYLGYVATRHHFTLARSVAIHFWYDFLLSATDFVLDPDHQPFVAKFGMPL